GAFMSKIHSKNISNRYIQYYLESSVFRGSLDNVKTETINQITQRKLKESLFPLPPLAEQERIVERLNELLPLCEKYI
ncbi:MAG: restriction endonuclease subunit S, partial [Synergistaceae bacterium]|nr:restriction endonuclease subunit S [Synergistaceae bacterium]